MLQSGALFVHVIAGLIALGAGAAALTHKKGASRHRTSGNVFFSSMLIMALFSVYLAYYKPETISMLNGFLTMYLVATGWVAARYARDESQLFDRLACAGAIVLTLTYALYGIDILQPRDVTGEGIPAGAYFVFGSIGLIGAVSDARMIWSRAQLDPRRRVIRHLWRMCVALFIAMESFFTGQPQLFPEAVQNGAILSFPAIVVLIVMLYWMIRYRASIRS